jgi:hypothetical protein
VISGDATISNGSTGVTDQEATTTTDRGHLVLSISLRVVTWLTQEASAVVTPIWYHFGMDLNVKGLDDQVGRRLKEQAEAEGVSVQEYVRRLLGRVAARRSPGEVAVGSEPMNREEFAELRRRLRATDA